MSPANSMLQGQCNHVESVNDVEDFKVVKNALNVCDFSDDDQKVSDNHPYYNTFSLHICHSCFTYCLEVKVPVH